MTLDHQEDFGKILEEENIASTPPLNRHSGTASSSPHELIFYFNPAHPVSKR